MPTPYSVPDQHRDFVLSIGLCLFFWASTTLYSRLLPALKGPSVATISVEGMCCQERGKPAIRELTRISGVMAIQPDYRNGAIELELRRSRPTSPQSLWDAVARASLQPVRLVIDNRTFTERPLE